jgi:phosphatidate cytidylyltransferase
MNGAGSERFADLRTRVLSGLVLAAVGLAGIWAGGPVFAALVGLSVAAMVWEWQRMLAPALDGAAAIAAALALGALVVAASLWLPAFAAAAVLVVPALAAHWLLPRLRQGGAAYLGLICLAGHALIVLRLDFGPWWMIWLVALVVASDVAGYFAGRFIGGPKFWPAVSPKKTWSGTVAGWLAGLAIGAGFVAPLGVGPGLIVLSLIVVMAGQLGDIAESALKRRVGVKDSSALIPGHGGVLDRFDAMMGAALVFLVVARLGLAGAVGAP